MCARFQRDSPDPPAQTAKTEKMEDVVVSVSSQFRVFSAQFSIKGGGRPGY